ncbi:MAG: Rho termination factor N-terminal domain-containing protein, partial [Vallitaleaceae bacterium]|nr:Rho termination factor N-terminal domain-containing protein [Vallitaleaceae bacterium]
MNIKAGDYVSADFSTLTLAQLRAKAKDLGMVSVTGFKKAELIQLLTDVAEKEKTREQKEVKTTNTVSEPSTVTTTNTVKGTNESDVSRQPSREKHTSASRTSDKRS